MDPYSIQLWLLFIFCFELTSLFMEVSLQKPLSEVQIFNLFDLRDLLERF